MQQKISNAFHLNGWLFTSAVFLFLLVPPLVQKGLFMDGTIYGSVARNLAIDEGSFSDLKFSETLLSSFHDHPPLAFGLQSLVFKVCGDQFFVERLYGLLIALGTAVLVVLTFRRMGGSPYYSWLPVLFWISTERVFWCFNQNMLENTMSFFSLLSFYFLLRSTRASVLAFYRWLLFAVLALYAAFLSKGLPGLFPLGFFVLHYLADPKTRSIVFALKQTVLFILSFVIVGSMLAIAFPELAESVRQYLSQQVLNSVQGHDRVGERLPFISGLFQQLLPLLILLVLTMIIHFRLSKSLPKTSAEHRLLLFTAHSAFLPLLVSPKLSFYYFVPAVPYFCLGFVLYLLSLTSNFEKYIKQNKNYKNAITLICSSLLLFVLAYSGKQIKGYERDEHQIRDVERLLGLVPKGETIAVSDDLKDDWTLIANLERYGNWSMVEKTGTSNYFLENRESSDAPASREIQGGLSVFRLSFVGKPTP
jgi:4-amino-4-deoxy-L-arabinose transferase-like glycosyltransferase